MMSENAAQNKGKRFADDLRRIRKRRGVSIDEVHEETKIPRGLIEAFEKSGLLDHPMFNRVYLRSFVRTYARVVDISPAFTLRALEEVLDGTYRGRLAEEYLGETEAAEETASAEEAEEPAREETEKEPAEEAAASEEAGREESEEEPDIAEEEEKAPGPQTSRTPEPQPSEAGATSGAAVGAAADQTRKGGQRQHGERRGPRRGRHRDTDTSAKRQGIYLGAALLVLAIGGWLLFSVLSDDSASDVEDGQAQAVAADTMAQEDTVSAGEAPAEPAEPVDIGQAMDFRVIAAQGPIRELRVKVDDDARRPYWIEEGEDQTFSAENQITFGPPIEATNEQPLEMMELELEGYSYPTTERDAQGRILVTRDRAQSYLDSLAAQQ